METLERIIAEHPYLNGLQPEYVTLLDTQIVFPPEPPVRLKTGRNGAQQARARRGLARRSEPLPASTVLAFTSFLDGRRSGNRSPVIPVGGL